MLLRFPTSTTARTYSCGTKLEFKGPLAFEDPMFDCFGTSADFPELALPLCELDGIAGLHAPDQLLIQTSPESDGGFLLRSSHPFFNPADKSDEILMIATKVQTIAKEEGGTECALDANSVIINGKTWLRSAPQLIEGLPYSPFPKGVRPNEEKKDLAISSPIELKQDELINGELSTMPLGVGRILGALASGFPAQFGLESFGSERQFLESLKYVYALLPAQLRHTISFAYGFARPQPVVMIQYYNDRHLKETCFSSPIATIPEDCSDEMSLQDVRGILAKKLRGHYMDDMGQESLEDANHEYDEFLVEGGFNFYDELLGLARETCAALGQTLNQIGIFNAPRHSFIKPSAGENPDTHLAFDALLTGEDPSYHRAGLFDLLSQFDNSTRSANKLLDDIEVHFKKEAYLVAVGLAATVRDNEIYCDNPSFLSLLESLLTIAQRLPVEEPFMEYRTRIIESVADGLRAYVGADNFLSPDQLFALSEFDQVANMIACVLETGDWSFTQRFNLGFTIFALCGENNMNDASALARRILPPSVVPHQWIHALINSRTLAESFEALIAEPYRLHKRETLFAINQMVKQLAQSNRKDLILDQVFRLGLTMPTDDRVDFKAHIGMAWDEVGLLRLEILRILSDATERLHSQQTHAAMVLNRPAN